MAVKTNELIYAGIGFLLVGILTPIGLGTIFMSNNTWTTYAGNQTNINSAVITLFTILLPIMYLIGAGLYFIPKMGK